MKRRILAMAVAIAFGMAAAITPMAPAQAGHDPFGKAEAALTILINTFLRPSMMVIGYVAGIVMSNAGTVTLNDDAQQALAAQGAAAQPSLGLSVVGVVGTLATAMGSNERPSAGLGSALSCPVFAGEGTLLGEDGCVWSKLVGQRTVQAGTVEQGASWRIGGQKEVAPGWFLGGALGAGPSWSQWGNLVEGRGQNFDASLALKHVSGPWLLAGALTLGASATHYRRFPGPGVVMQSDANLLQAGLRLRAAYDFAFDSWYLRPRLDLDGYYTSLAGFQEYGRGIAVAVNGTDRFSVAVAPTLELGGRIQLGAATIVRPYVAGGVLFVPSNDWSLGTRFVGGLSAFGTSRVTYTGPPVLALVEAGLQLYQERGFDVRAEYRLASGNSVLAQALSLRGSWHF